MDEINIRSEEEAAEVGPDGGGTETERERIRELLRKAYGVESMFVRVKTLSKILGLDPATIYASMRAGRFPLGHTVICSAPMVRTDHLVDWICVCGHGARSGPLGDELVRPQATDLSERAAMRQLRKKLIAETMAKVRG